MKDLSDYCDRDKVREILNYAKTASRRDYLILKVLWESGMRVSELAALTPRDLEPQNHAVVIRNGKGNKSRRVYVDYKTETMKMLCGYVSAMNVPEEEPIFGVKMNQLRNIVKKYGSMAHVNIHPTHFAIALLSTWYGRGLIYDAYSSYWGIRTLTPRQYTSSLRMQI